MEHSLTQEFCLIASAIDRTHFSRNIDLLKPPKSLSEALARPDQEAWIDGMGREVVSLKETGTIVITPLPPGRKAIPVKWVFDFKYHPDGTIIAG